MILEFFSSVTAMPYIFEGLGCVLAGKVEYEIFSSTLSQNQLLVSIKTEWISGQGSSLRMLMGIVAEIVHFAMNDHIEIVFGVVRRYVLEGEYGGGRGHWM